MKQNSLFQRSGAMLCGCVLVAALLASATALAQQAAKAAGEPAATQLASQPPEAAIAEAASDGAQSRRLMSNKLMIFWSEARDVAWGFSNSLGRWTRQELNPPAPAGPQLGTSGIVVGDDIAVWRIGSTYYAYSGPTGRWDVLRLPEGRTPPPEVHEAFVLVHDGDDVHTFAAATGRWWSPNGKDTAADAQPEEPSIKVFTLRHTKASDAERLIGQLFPRDIQSVAADSRTNSVIVRGDPETLNVIFSILTRLDEQGESEPASPAAGAVSRDAPASASVAESKKQFESEDRKAAELVRQLEELRTAAWPDKGRIEKLSADLRRAVAAAFAARQQLHRAEMAQLQDRLAAVQRNLRTREQLSEQIIDRRVKELLNPETEWETRPQSSNRASTSPNWLRSGPGTTSTPSTSQRTARTGIWWDRDSEQLLQDLGLHVQKLTAEDAPEPTLVGAMKITAIDPDSPAKELNVGDLIVAVQSTGISGHGGRRVELHVRSGNKAFYSAFEISDGRAKTITGPFLDTTRTVPAQAANQAAARAYRDKLRERWQQIHVLYKNGRFPLDELLRGAKDLVEAEITAAGDRDERLAALRASVERLKQVKAIVDAKVEAQNEPEFAKLAVDAEFLKAEAALDALEGVSAESAGKR